MYIWGHKVVPKNQKCIFVEISQCTCNTTFPSKI